MPCLSSNFFKKIIFFLCFFMPYPIKGEIFRAILQILQKLLRVLQNNFALKHPYISVKTEILCREAFFLLFDVLGNIEHIQLIFFANVAAFNDTLIFARNIAHQKNRLSEYAVQTFFIFNHLLINTFFSYSLTSFIQSAPTPQPFASQ